MVWKMLTISAKIWTKKLLDDLHATQDALSDENALHDQLTAETGHLESNCEDLQRQLDEANTKSLAWKRKRPLSPINSNTL
jgi:hypothetical protein